MSGPAVGFRLLGLREALAAAQLDLAAAGIASPRADAELLAAHAAGVPLTRLRSAAWSGRTWAALAHDGDERSATTLASRFARLIEARCERTPLQHLTGVAPFRTLELSVGPGVFIPRPETELTAGAALDALAAMDRSAPLLAVDLCAGSGAIAATLLAEGPAHLHVLALDIDPIALAYARRNLAGSGAGLIRADVSQALPLSLDGKVDLVVSNPPYLVPGQAPEDEETARHDPPAALYGGGPDGLDLPAAIVRHAARLLRDGGVLVMEHAIDQAEATRRLALEVGAWSAIKTLADLAGRPRILRAVAAA